MKYYTGVGSRKTPKDICQKMTEIAAKLESFGYILRSGGADGADIAFEMGVKDPDNKHIYLPWKNFNHNPSHRYWAPSREVYTLTKFIHPNYNMLSSASQKLHARNFYQVLGDDLSTPSDFLICWTENGKEIGGTRTALKVAYVKDIPVYNLAVKDFDWSILEKRHDTI